MRAGGWRESREQPSDRFPGLPSTRLVNKDAEPPEERPPGLPWTGGERRGREESGGGVHAGHEALKKTHHLAAPGVGIGSGAGVGAEGLQMTLDHQGHFCSQCLSFSACKLGD